MCKVFHIIKVSFNFDFLVVGLFVVVAFETIMSKQPGYRAKSERSKQRSKTKSKSKKSRNIPINYENPTVPRNDGRAHVTSQVETVDICNDTHQENEEEKYNHKTKAEGKLWDEVEMKTHGYVDKKGHHTGQMSDENKHVPDRRIPSDELAMKQCGLVDSHCHHMTEEEIHPHQQEEQQDLPHVNFVSLAESPSLRESSTSSEAATSNAELLVTLRESMGQGENILNDLKYKHEYIEYRVGEKGRAMALWHDGSEDTYEFTGDSVYQITREQN